MVEESGHLLPTSVLLPRAAPPLTGSPPFRGLGRTTCCLSSCLVTLLLHLGMLLKMANPRPRIGKSSAPGSSFRFRVARLVVRQGKRLLRCSLLPGDSRRFKIKNSQMAYLAMSGLGEAVEDFRAATCRFGNELFLPVGPESFK